MVVDSSCRDAPKYAGEGVALCGTPGALGAPLLHYSCLFMAILGNFRELCFRHRVSEARHLICQHYIIKCCTCIGHVTIYYKRATNALVGVFACCSSIHQVRLYHQRPACGWCLIHVGRNASSTSPGGSLLPSTVIIVLAFVNSTMSPAGTPKYLNETRECCSTPC